MQWKCSEIGRCVGYLGVYWNDCRISQVVRFRMSRVAPFLYASGQTGLIDSILLNTFPSRGPPIILVIRSAFVPRVRIVV
jgi:hypothetical protein